MAREAQRLLQPGCRGVSTPGDLLPSEAVTELWLMLFLLHLVLKDACAAAFGLHRKKTESEFRVYK